MYLFLFAARGDGSKMSMRTSSSELLAKRNCGCLSKFGNMLFCTHELQFLTVLHTLLIMRSQKDSLSYGVVHLALARMTCHSTVVWVIQETVWKCLRAKDLNIDVDGCASYNQSVFVNQVLGICGAYSLGGLSTVGVGCQVQWEFCNARYYSFLLGVVVSINLV